MRMLSTSPRLYAIDDFATDAEIAHVLTVAAAPLDLIRRGILPGHNTTGFSFEMPVQGDAMREGLAQRIYSLLGMDNDVGETMRFRRYAVGESHPIYGDAWQIDGSHLIVTALLYLNDTEAGGETHFPLAQPASVLVAPGRGRLAVWFNYTPDGEVDPNAIHEARVVERGTKCTITNFIYKPLAYAATNLFAEVA
jgi:2-oxoglutarate-Fe(II)-dependent oxygenase superfamily protein